jgi:transposase
VITVQTWHTIRGLAAQGCSHRFIARTLGVSRKTVRRALRGDAPATYGRKPVVQESLQAFRPDAQAGIRRGKAGLVLLEEARQAGYAGSDATFYRWLGQVRAATRRGDASVRFETGPAEQSQFDWSPYTVSLGAQLLDVIVFAHVLGYSRRIHFTPSLAADQESILDALEEGWRHFGGACGQLVIDNAKSMVLRHRRSHVEWNACFLALCGAYRVTPIAATPGHAQTKGKVENPFRVLETRLIKGGQWRDWEHFAADLAAYEAQREERTHSTTRQTPQARFEHERSLLLPLPARPFLGCPAQLRHVNNDGLFSFRANRYAVPQTQAAGIQMVRVRVRQGRELLVYDLAGKLLIRHPLNPPHSPPAIPPECYAGLRPSRRSLMGLVAEFRQHYGSAGCAREYLDLLLARHSHRPEDPLGEVLALLASVPADVAVQALARCVEYRLPEPRMLEAFLTRQLAQGQLAQGQLAQGQQPIPLAQASGASMPPTSPTSPTSPASPAVGAASPLPCLDVERPLTDYASLLPKEELR